MEKLWPPIRAKGWRWHACTVTAVDYVGPLNQHVFKGQGVIMDLRSGSVCITGDQISFISHMGALCCPVLEVSVVPVH